jgi:hypothetical protein
MRRAPAMGADGVMRLAPCVEPPTHEARPRGDVVLPGSPKLEQDIAWVFPDVASQPISPQLVRHRVRWQWLWAVGVAAHREFIAHVPLNEFWMDAAVRGAHTSIVPAAAAVLSGADKPASTLHVVAGLDRNVDIFGAPTKAQFDAVWWGLRAEFALAQAYPETVEQTPLNQLRYASFDGLLEDEYESLLADSGQLWNLVEIYCHGSYDIAALSRGQQTLAQLGPRAQRLKRRQNVIVALRATGRRRGLDTR